MRYQQFFLLCQSRRNHHKLVLFPLPIPVKMRCDIANYFNHFSLPIYSRMWLLDFWYSSWFFLTSPSLSYWAAIHTGANQSSCNWVSVLSWKGLWSYSNSSWIEAVERPYPPPELEDLNLYPPQQCNLGAISVQFKTLEKRVEGGQKAGNWI